MTGTTTGIPGFIGHMISHVTDKSISELVNVSKCQFVCLEFQPTRKKALNKLEHKGDQI